MSLVEHWQFVENVVAAIEAFANGKLPDVAITPKAMIPTRHHPEVLREVDVLVCFRAGSRTLRIGVDVKAESRPVDLPLLDGLWAKAEGLELDRYAVVSLSGFTSSARTVYREKGVELVTLEEVGDLRWAGLAHISMINRVFEFEHTTLDYGSEPHPSEECVKRSGNWIVTGSDNQPTPWMQYLAANVGRAVPMETGGPREGRSQTYTANLSFAHEVRAGLSINDGVEAVPVPLSVVTRGYFRWETRDYPVVQYRLENGQEVVSAAVEIPGLQGGPFQMSMAMTDEPGGNGQGLALHMAPAKPRRSTIGSK